MIRYQLECKAKIIKFQVHLFSMVDACTSWTEFARIPSASSITTAKAFDQNWLCRYPRQLKCVHNNGKERVLAGQTADTATSAVAINHRFTGGESMQVAEVDGFGRRLIAACHRCLGIDRDAEAMLLARGNGGVQGSVRTARDAASQRGQSNGRFINHFDIISVAIRQAADIGPATGTVDDRFAILEAVAVSQIDRSAGDTDGNAGIESNAKTAGGTGSQWRR